MAQGVCPVGWHVPSYAEWGQLTSYVSGQNQYWCDNDSNNTAKALAASNGWYYYSDLCSVGNNPNANNAAGFSALPVGRYTTYLYQP